MNFIAKYKIKGTTPVKIKTSISLPLIKINNPHNNPKDKSKKLDIASMTQLYNSYLLKKSIIIDKALARRIFFILKNILPSLVQTFVKAVSFSCFV